MRRLPSMLLIGLLGVTPAVADTIELNDGTRLEGDIKRNNEGWVVIGPTGKMTYVPPDQIKSIQMSPATNPSAVQERIATLRRSVEHLNDTKQIIERYERFLGNQQDPESKRAAEADLAEWREKQARGVVKLGNQWVEAAEKAKVQEQSLAQAALARDYMKQGRLKEAEPLLDQALKTDPGNASALYLKGLLALRQEQLPAARKAFEAALTLVPDHAPTLNNLAITVYKQNQVGAAFHHYDRAMTVAPEDRMILANVAEAMEAQRDQRVTAESYRRAAKRFDETIARLEAKLAGEGLYRWGAAWVKAEDMEKLRAAEEAQKAKLDELSVDYDASEARVRQIDDNIADNKDEMERMQRDTLRYDSTGRLIRTQLPSSYYRRSDDNQRLLQQRATEITKMEKLRTQAVQIQRQLPVPKFTGQQMTIGPEGTPVVPVVSVPTTAPSTQPAF